MNCVILVEALWGTICKTILNLDQCSEGHLKKMFTAEALLKMHDECRRITKDQP